MKAICKQGLDRNLENVVGLGFLNETCELLLWELSLSSKFTETKQPAIIFLINISMVVTLVLMIIIKD